MIEEMFVGQAHQGYEHDLLFNSYFRRYQELIDEIVVDI